LPRSTLSFMTCQRRSVCRRIGFCSRSTASVIRKSRRRAGTYFDLMRRAFPSKAQSLGYEVIDLDSVFFDQYAAHGQRFEHPRDGHWNGTGHAVVVKAVLASKLAIRLLGQR
jgi:hypothetical protein